MDNGINPVTANLPIKVDERIDESKWRDIDVFLPVDDADQFEQIQNLFRVSKNRPTKNFIILNCQHHVGKSRCKYKIRWRKSDGMVQSKGKHGHEKFSELRWRKCRECNFECANKAMLSNHYLQHHNDKQFRFCPKCVATFEDPNELHWHIQQKHANKKKRENKEEGDLAELQQRLDVIIQEWETQQRMNQEQQQVASTSNLAIGGGLSNDRNQYAVQNNISQQQSNLIPSTSNAMPTETPYFLKTTNWSEENDGMENIDE